MPKLTPKVTKHQLQYSVVIPSNKHIEDIIPLLESLAKQTIAPREVIIVRDRYVYESELEAYRIGARLPFVNLQKINLQIVQPLYRSGFEVGKGVSYVRNTGIAEVSSPYVLLIDDDNVCPDTMMASLIADLQSQAQVDRTVLAALQYDNKEKLRNSLASGFRFLFSRPRWIRHYTAAHSDHVIPLMMASSNTLFGPTRLFREFPFDEEIPFVYEDLIMTSQMTKAGVALLASPRAQVVHHHHHRNRLSALYADTPERLFLKAKHRVVLVAEIGNAWQRFIFRFVGIHGQNIRIMLHVMYFVAPAQRRSYVRALWNGSKAGFEMVKRRKRTQ